MENPMNIPLTQPTGAPALPPAATSAILGSDIVSMIVTLMMAIGLGILATVTARQFTPSSPRVLWLAIAVGGLGGLAHEVAQSRGTILVVERRADGIYLGAIGGVALGAVAGLLAVKGLLITPTSQLGATQLIYEAFIAGLALKGITEAAGGQALPVTSVNTKP
jgi:hypothetical protein